MAQANDNSASPVELLDGDGVISMEMDGNNLVITAKDKRSFRLLKNLADQQDLGLLFGYEEINGRVIIQIYADV